MTLYPYILAFHTVGMVAWMAGMFYLPRLFVYHAEAKIGSELSETFKVMERRLLRFIMTPAMIVTWLCGLWLLHLMPVYLQLPWMQVKLVLVLMMSGMHGYYAGAVRRFALDKNTKSHRFWRWMNEAPTVLLIAIVLLVVVKP